MPVEGDNWVCIGVQERQRCQGDLELVETYLRSRDAWPVVVGQGDE